MGLTASQSLDLCSVDLQNLHLVFRCLLGSSKLCIRGHENAQSRLKTSTVDRMLSDLRENLSWNEFSLMKKATWAFWGTSAPKWGIPQIPNLFQIGLLGCRTLSYDISILVQVGSILIQPFRTVRRPKPLQELFSAIFRLFCGPQPKIGRTQNSKNGSNRSGDMSRD